MQAGPARLRRVGGIFVGAARQFRRGATDHSDLVKVIVRHAAALAPKDSRLGATLDDEVFRPKGQSR